MTEQSQPPAMLISSAKELEKTIKISLYGIIVAFLESDSSEIYNKFTKVANLGRDEIFSFYYSLDKTLWSKHGGKDSVVIFLPRWYLTEHEQSSVIIEDFLDKSEDEVLQLIRTNIRSLVGIRSSHSAEKMFSEYPLLVAYFDLDDSEDGREGTHTLQCPLCQLLTTVLSRSQAHACTHTCAGTHAHRCKTIVHTL